MKKYIYAVVGLVLGSLISGGIVLASGVVNGQYTTYQNTTVVSVPQGQLSPNFVSKEMGSVRVVSNPVSNVPKGVYTAHITTDKGMIDVQRFIDPATSVACYYSVVSSTNQVLANCVLVSNNAQ